MLSYIFGSETYLRVTFLVSELLEDTFQYQKYSSRGNLSSIWIARGYLSTIITTEVKETFLVSELLEDTFPVS